MKFNRTKNTLRNSFWGFFNQIIQNLLPFITRTLLIRLLGAEYLGLNSLFASILQFLNLAEAGFGVAIVYGMYKPIADNDKNTICALLNLFRKIYRIVGFIVLCVGLLILPFLEFFIKADYPRDVNIYLLYCIYLANSVLSYFLFAYKNSLFNAFQRNDKLSQIDTFISIFKPVVQIVLLLFFKNLYIYTIVIPVMTITRNITVSVLASKVYPEYVCKGFIAKEQKKDIYKKTLGLFISKISQTTRDSFDSIFISYFIGLITVTIYSNYYYIMNAVHGFLSIICMSMTAGVGNFIANENKDKIEELFNSINFLYMMISGWCFVCLMVLYQPFMNIWVGNELMFNNKGVVMICIYFYLLTMGDIKGVFSGAFGMWWDFKYCSVIEAFSNLLLNFILAKKIGIYGILLGTIINLFAINFIFTSYILFKKHFSIKDFFYYLFNHLKYFVVTLSISFILNFFIKKFIFEYSIENFIIKILVCFIFVPLIYFLVFSYKFKRNAVIKKLLNKIQNQ